MLTFSEVLENLKLLTYQLPIIRINDVVEIILITFVIYQVMTWVRGTRAWMLVKGISVLFIIAVLAMIFELNTILWIFANTISVGITALLIVFQPELRKALEQLGRKNIIFTFNLFEEQKDRFEKLTIDIIEEILKAVDEMSKVKTGALIVIEQDILLHEYEKTGIMIDAIVSKQMLINIFENNTPLHDGAVIIRDDRIAAATCYLPLSENMTLSKELGTRHRAAVGITEVTDCIVIVVSEETGAISMALGGNLIRKIDTNYLRNKLLYVQKKTVDVNKFKIWKGRHKHDKKDNE